jgi:uncharacterized membrane protein
VGISKLDHDEHEQLVGYEHVAAHVRRLRQRAWSNRLAESLLFLPVLLLAAAVLIEEALAAADRQFGVSVGALDLPPDAAVALLSTVAGATITTAGVVFSLLVVSLQLASGQFSPRVLRTFWRDRFGQLLVGLLLATFAFCVLALTQVDTSAERAPILTMSGALLLALASIVAIVAYLNRITRQQYVGRILESIAEETLELVRELPYGSRVGQRVGDPVQPPDLASLGEPLVVRASVDGWVQQISRRAVIGAAPPESVVRIETRVGAYLIADTPLVTIWPRPAPEVAARFVREVSKAVIVGVSRTMQQDIDFGLRQLNDIALRALSPAVNDPTTAIEAILRVSSIMRPLLCAELPTQAVRDQAGRFLLTPWDLDYGEYLTHAYAQVRRYAGPHLEVMLALVRNLRMLRAACMATGARESALVGLDEQVQAALAAAEAAGLSKSDIAALRQAAGPR